MKLSKLGLGIWVLASASLVACGGDSGGSNARNATLDDIVGVWDLSDTEDGFTDEYYAVFRTDGTITEYDYLGDSFDEGPDCYVDYHVDYRDLGNGQFFFDVGDGDTYTAQLTINGNRVNTNILSGEGVFDGTEGISFSAVKSSRSESSFTPDCNAKSAIGETELVDEAALVLDSNVDTLL